MSKRQDITWYTAENSGIQGRRIVVQARDITAPRVVPRSGRHKAQQSIAKLDAEAWIESPKQYVQVQKKVDETIEKHQTKKKEKKKR